MKFQICSICVVAMATVSMAIWQNDFDGPLNFQCHDDQTIDYVKSIHDNGAEDRRFDIGCKTMGVDTPNKPVCHWPPNYANSVDQLLHYECPTNHYMAGMASVHDNGAEDRQWKFYCCEIADVHLTDCEFTGWTNQYDKPQDYHVPDGKALKGTISIHNNGPEDRLYEYVVCTVEIRSDGVVVG